MRRIEKPRGRGFGQSDAPKLSLLAVAADADVDALCKERESQAGSLCQGKQALTLTWYDERRLPSDGTGRLLAGEGAAMLPLLLAGYMPMTFVACLRRR